VITVMGLGFVGLTTGLGFAEHGHKVFGYDIDSRLMARLENGEIPFYEPELGIKLKQHLASGNFRLVDNLAAAITASRYIFICVGTPNRKGGGINLDFVVQAVDAVIKNHSAQSFRTIVIKSTVVPGTVRDFIRPHIEQQGLRIGKDIGLAVNPEFLREGSAWHDFLYPDRIVIGAEDRHSESMLCELYRSFNVPVYKVSSTTAEYIKYLSNTLLATLISFANEQSLLAKHIGDIDIKTAFSVLHRDKRWSGSPAKMASYVYPGCGFGGYCLPKDTQALVEQLRLQNHNPVLLSSVLAVNKAIKEAVVADVVNIVSPTATIGILGLAFKPNTDDVRETPAKDIIGMLLAKGYINLIAYDPLAMPAFKAAYGLPIKYADSLETCVISSDLLVLVTAWDLFIDNKELLKQKPVLDYRFVL